MPKLSPYIFSQDARKQADFYASALGGSIVDVRTFAEAPGSKPEDKDRVMHLVLQIGEQTVFMADSAHEPSSQVHGIDLTLEFPTEAEGKSAYEALVEGGTVIMPFQRMFWGTPFGRLKDPFGVTWQISAES